MEENNDEVPAEETSDRGVCARALYDYQAGEGFFFFLLFYLFFLVLQHKSNNGQST